jgi:hypothetical protein
VPLLNLTENEQQDFDAIDSGRYFAEIYEAEERQTKGGENAKLPKGTPFIWLHFKITGRVGEDDGPNEESEYYNRRVFRNLIVPPEKVAGKKYEHYKKMNGQIVRFLTCAGYPEEEVTKGDFELDTDDLVERPIIVVVKKKPDKAEEGAFINEVAGFRNINDVQEAGASSGLL